MTHTETASTGCEMNYYCDAEHTCALVDQLNHQAVAGGEQTDGQPSGEVFTAQQWDRYGRNLDRASKEAHCPLHDHILFRHKQLRQKKKDTGALIIPPGYPEAA